MSKAHVEIELEGTKWSLIIDINSVHTLTSPSGKEVVAYNAVISAVIE